jgi:glycosyltransferase involved in cell wall biosynthesis
VIDAARSEPLTAADVTVVIPTRNRPDRLAACLAAVAALEPPPAGVVVVDSASDDASAIAEVVGRGELVRCDLPGASRARNAGWERATTGIVAFIDDDVRVAPDWAARIAEPFADPGVVLVTGSVRAGDQLGHEGAVAVTDDVASGPFDHSTMGNVGASANMAVRRDLLGGSAGFDVLLGAGARFRAAEDLDLFDRLLTVGGGWHAAGAVGMHDQWRSRGELLRLERDYGTGWGVRLSKVVRVDRRRAGAMVRYELRRLGRDLVGDARRRYVFGIVRRVTWAVAVGAGAVRGMRLGVQGGHLRPR